MGVKIWLFNNSDDIKTVLLFISSIVWLVFFVEAVSWRNLKSLRGKHMLMFLIGMYFIQFLSLLFFAYFHAYCHRDDLYMHITFFNWFVLLVNTIASREAIPRGYKKRGKIGLVVCLVQFVVYLVIFLFAFLTGVS